MSIKPSDKIAKEKPSRFIQQRLSKHGCTKVWTSTNPQKQSQFVLNIRFASALNASNCMQVYCQRQTITSTDKKTLTLSQEAITSTLNQLGIVHYGQTNPVPILQALQHEHQQQTTLNTAVGFFDAPEKESPVEQLIKILTKQPEASRSFFYQSLITFLKKLPPNHSSLIMAKIKDFIQDIQAPATEKEPHTQMLIKLILDPDINNLCELMDKLNTATTQESTPKKPSHK